MRALRRLAVVAVTFTLMMILMLRITDETTSEGHPAGAEARIARASRFARNSPAVPMQATPDAANTTEAKREFVMQVQCLILLT